MKNIGLFFSLLLVMITYIHPVKAGDDSSLTNSVTAIKSQEQSKDSSSIVATIAGKTGASSISKKELLKAHKIRIKINGSVDSLAKVVSYSFSTVLPKGTFMEVPVVPSEQITPKIKNLIARTPINKKVYFENIKAKMPDGTIKLMDPVILKILEE